MRRSRRAARFAAALFIVASAFAVVRVDAQQDGEAPSTTDHAAGLRRLVEQEVPRLTADLRADRIAAEERLLEAGPAVVEWLPLPDELTNAATREAVRRIRTELERRAALASVQPGRVTVRGTLTLAEIAHEITSQTGNPVSIPSDAASIGERRLDVDYADVPFWDALRDISDRLDLRAGVDADSQSVILAPPATDRPLARTTAGAFQVEVLSVRSRNGIVGVEFAVTAEPRLRPLFLTWSDADFTARDSADETLPPLSPGARRELPTLDRGPARFSIVFESDRPGAPGSIAVGGNILSTTAALVQEFRFLKLPMAGGEVQRRGGVTVTCADAEFSTTRRGVRRAAIELTVVYDAGGPAFESHRTWVYHNEVFLEAPDGTRLPVNDGFETLGEQNGAVAVRYRFRDLPDVPPEDWRLVYHAPTAVIDVPVEFEFERLPVPP